MALGLLRDELGRLTPAPTAGDLSLLAVSRPVPPTFFRLLGFLRPYRASLIVSSVLAILAQGAAIAVAAR